MSNNFYLTRRDYSFFDDIRRFGFTTADHCSLRFSMKLKIVSRRFVKFQEQGYIKRKGRSLYTKRYIFVPDENFYTVVPYHMIYRFNILTIAHDEYILLLYSLLSRTKWSNSIYLEQDVRKQISDKVKLLRIPDLTIRADYKRYVFEYERTQKSTTQYEEMNLAFEKEDQFLNHFVFICENDLIALKIQENMHVKNISIIKPEKFLFLLKKGNYENLNDYVTDKTIQYF